MNIFNFSKEKTARKKRYRKKKVIKKADTKSSSEKKNREHKRLIAKKIKAAANKQMELSLSDMSDFSNLSDISTTEEESSENQVHALFPSGRSTYFSSKQAVFPMGMSTTQLSSSIFSREKPRNKSEHTQNQLKILTSGKADQNWEAEVAVTQVRGYMLNHFFDFCFLDIY